MSLPHPLWEHSRTPSRARRRPPNRRPESDIEWILGDLESTSWEREFDCVVMTGRAFQVLLGDDEPRAALAAVRGAPTDGGRFGFETRVPLPRAWESWTTLAPVDVPAPGAGGSATMPMNRQVRSVDGEIASFRTGLVLPGERAPRHNDSGLRFLGAGRPDTFLTEAGPVAEERCGDRDRGPPTDAGPEIITVARRTPA
ncbi:SAM-dependent methyltransferase [Streptomyces sp. PSRA5]|uniref:SAM-dependent methyltransferase n=1 Tax=Streptomyces panacea TaxID=3035064 RepID=UPI00339C2385